MNREHHHNKNCLNPQGETCGVVETIHFPSIDSSNRWGKEHLDRWPKMGILCLTASELTAGRGRWGRKWHAPPGVNIYVSFCFWYDSKRNDVGNIPQIMALAAVTTLEELHFSPTIKWPNDLLLSGKKMGGILCETVVYQGRLGIICGIGLNINMALADLHAIGRPATSLFAETGELYDLDAVLNQLKHNFEIDLNQFLMEGFSPFHQRFVEKSHFKRGDLLSFHHGGELVTGQWSRLTEEGAVELILSDGTEKVFHSGEFVET